MKRRELLGEYFFFFLMMKIFIIERKFIIDNIIYTYTIHIDMVTVTFSKKYLCISKKKIVEEENKKRTEN